MSYITRIILLLFFVTFLLACSSSSYYERYRSVDTSGPSVDTVEDESSFLPNNVSKIKEETIISKLSGATNSNRKKELFLKEIISYLNTPYRYGGETRSGIDCSAFTQKVYSNSLQVQIPRTAREQYKAWRIFKDLDNLRFGDLIYFDTSERYFPGHVGIYLDDNLFAHASSSKGVIVSSLNNDYYADKFVGANRVKIKP